MSYVYIAPLTNKTAFKIGQSNNPKERLISLNKYYNFDFNNTLLVNCNNVDNAYKFESILHNICEKHRLFFENNGGTEFFSYDIYNELISILETSVKIKSFTLEKIPENSINPHLTNIKIDEIENIIDSLAFKIKCRRLACNITQKQLAKIVGVSRRTIQNVESSKDISLSTFIRILKCLNLDYILSDLEVSIPLKERSR